MRDVWMHMWHYLLKLNDYLVLTKSKLYHHDLYGGLFDMAVGSQDEEPSYLNFFELEDKGYPCCF
jgi:hypothetical protein